MPAWFPNVQWCVTTEVDPPPIMIMTRLFSHEPRHRDQSEASIQVTWSLSANQIPRHRDWAGINLRLKWKLLRFSQDESVYWDVTRNISQENQSTQPWESVVESLILKVIDGPQLQSKHLSEHYKPLGENCVLSHLIQKHKIIPSLWFGWTRVYDRRSV